MDSAAYLFEKLQIMHENNNKKSKKKIVKESINPDMIRTNSWTEMIDELDEIGYEVDSDYINPPPFNGEKVVLIKRDNIYEVPVTRYFYGEYNLYKSDIEKIGTRQDEFFESNKLEEASTNNVSTMTFNRMKRALNAHNTLKDIVVLTPIINNRYTNRHNRYQVTLPIGMYIIDQINNTLKDQSDWSEQYNKENIGTSYGDKFELYNVLIDFMNETFEFQDSYDLTYNLDKLERYITKYLELHDLDFKTFADKLKDVIESSKQDLGKLLNSKNFIYNLNKSRDFQNVKYDIELTEALDESTPRWLRNAINLNIDDYYVNSVNIPLDNIKWVETDAPHKGKWDNTKIHAFLINPYGKDSKYSDNFVYVPILRIGNDETIEVNGRQRDINKMSVSALEPYVIKYAYADNVDELKQDVTNKRKDRFNSIANSIDRNKVGPFSGKLDKSGYPIDPNKYKRKLAQLNATKYSERLDDLYDALIGVKNELLKLTSNSSFIADPKHRYSISDVKRKYTSAIKEYDNATRNYAWAMDELDTIKSSNFNSWRGEGFENFDKYGKMAEDDIVKAYDIINENK